MAKEPTVTNIVHDYLEISGYDGLYNPGLCACELSDLMPCGEVQGECYAGYKIDGDGLKCDCNFHISKTRDSTDYECEI